MKTVLDMRLSLIVVSVSGHVILRLDGKNETKYVYSDKVVSMAPEPVKKLCRLIVAPQMQPGRRSAAPISIINYFPR